MIIDHIGSENGFIKDSHNHTGQKDAQLNFLAKKKTKLGESDYDLINRACFEKWFQSSFDNAFSEVQCDSYERILPLENKERVSNDEVENCDIQIYLMRKEILWLPSDTKRELMGNLNHLNCQLNSTTLTKWTLMRGILF